MIHNRLKTQDERLMVNCLGWLALCPCHSVAYDMQTEMSSIACWRFMLACWQTCGYFNIFPNNVNKKMNKKALFLAALSAVEGINYQ